MKIFKLLFFTSLFCSNFILHSVEKATKVEDQSQIQTFCEDAQINKYIRDILIHHANQLNDIYQETQKQYNQKIAEGLQGYMTFDEYFANFIFSVSSDLKRDLTNLFKYEYCKAKLSESQKNKIRELFDTACNNLLTGFLKEKKLYKTLKTIQTDTEKQLTNILKENPDIRTRLRIHSALTNITAFSIECANDQCKKKENRVKFKKCSRCEQKYYCSEACQKADWKKHKPNCIAKPKEQAKDKSEIPSSSSAAAASVPQDDESIASHDEDSISAGDSKKLHS